MHDLAPIAPLGENQPRIEVFGGVTIREVTDLALASLAIRRDCDAGPLRKAESFLGFELPGPGGHCAGDAYSATWMASGQWFVGAALPEHELLADDLKRAVGEGGSVTDQTDAWCSYEIEGSRCLDLFERLTAVDLGDVEAGAAIRLRLEHLSCLVICQRKGAAFLILGQRSVAASLFHALEVAAKSSG